MPRAVIIQFVLRLFVLACFLCFSVFWAGWLSNPITFFKKRSAATCAIPELVSARNTGCDFFRGEDTQSQEAEDIDRTFGQQFGQTLS